MTISKSLDEKFIDRLKITVEDQQRLIDNLAFDLSENTKQIIKLAAQISELAEKDKGLVNEIIEESYFLEKFNDILKLHLIGELPKKSEG